MPEPRDSQNSRRSQSFGVIIASARPYKGSKETKTTFIVQSYFENRNMIVCNQASGPENKHMFRISIMWFIFDLQRRKIWIAQKHIYNIYNESSTHLLWFRKNKRPLLEVVALCARMQTSLLTSPTLWIDWPYPTSPFGPRPYPQTFSSTPPFRTCNTFNWQKMTLTHWDLLTSCTMLFEAYGNFYLNCSLYGICTVLYLVYLGIYQNVQYIEFL